MRNDYAMSLAEYSKQIKLAIALNDARGLEILITSYLVDDCGIIRKAG